MRRFRRMERGKVVIIRYVDFLGVEFKDCYDSFL